MIYDIERNSAFSQQKQRDIDQEPPIYLMSAQLTSYLTVGAKPKPFHSRSTSLFTAGAQAFSQQEQAVSRPHVTGT
jgi:hypothetical protein